MPLLENIFKAHKQFIMSQQNHNRNQYVNVKSLFQTIPDHPSSNGASESNAAYDSLPYNQRQTTMPIENNQTADEFVQGNSVPNTCAVNLEHPLHALMSAISGSEFVINDSNEFNIIARTLTDVGKRLCIKTCIKKVLFHCLNRFNRIQHGGYDLQSNSVCGIVIATWNVQSADATRTWWADIRKIIVSTQYKSSQQRY